MFPDTWLSNIWQFVLHNLHATQGAALVVSHDRFFLREFATRVLEIADGKLKDYDSWDAYQAAAPRQWQEAQEAEVDFIKQDAKVAKVWSRCLSRLRKKMSRLRKREGKGIGLRRLSSRVEEFMEPDEDPRPRFKKEKPPKTEKLPNDEPSTLSPSEQP
eukprot:s597_g31.t1